MGNLNSQNVFKKLITPEKSLMDVQEGRDVVERQHDRPMKDGLKKRNQLRVFKVHR